MEELLIDAELEIEILGLTQEGVNLKLRLRRDRQKGLREDSLNAMFAGVILKEEEYVALQTGTIIVFNGIKVKVARTGGTGIEPVLEILKMPFDKCPWV